jgi:hypothetical protein
MAHIQQARFIGFIKESLPDYFTEKSVLEIGSLDINGSAREKFTNCQYLGIDIGNGKGVDLVSTGEDFSGKANSFDVVLSCECFEHNPEYEKTWINMVRVLKRNGLLMMTCATFGRKQHGTSMADMNASPLTVMQGQQYYKNLSEDDFNFLDLKNFLADYVFLTDYSSSDLYFVGLGKDANPSSLAKFAAAKEIAVSFYDRIARCGLN